MRIWSIHPKYLDSKGLVALWRESLLAKRVLQGKTKGYTNHPQLYRFRKLNKPVEGIHQYMSIVFEEAEERAYNFDKSKIRWKFDPVILTVTKGQLEYERNHFLEKLKVRAPQLYQKQKTIREFDAHPLFNPVEGGIEDWENIKT